MLCIATAHSVPAESWYASLFCAVYNMSGASDRHRCILLHFDLMQFAHFNVPLMMHKQIDIDSLCILCHALHAIYCYMPKILLHALCRLLDVHLAREPLPALLQYSHFSQNPSFYNMASLCSPITSLQASLTNIKYFGIVTISNFSIPTGLKKPQPFLFNTHKQ